MAGRYGREVRVRGKCGRSTRMKRQQCLERGPGRLMLIYASLIGNSRGLHLNRTLVSSKVGGARGGRGSASMAALLAPHVVVTVLQNTEPETELGTTLLLPPSKQGGEPTSCVTVWIQHNPTCNMAALQLSQLPG